MKLDDRISTLKGIGEKKEKAFKAEGISTIEDLLYFFPRKYEDRRTETKICDLEPGKDFLISGKIISRRYTGNPYKKNTPLTILVSDDTGTIEAVFFNGRYIANLLNINGEYSFYGRVSSNFNRLQMVHPEFHRKGDKNDIRGIIPVYPQISGISQNEVRRLENDIRELYPLVEEWLPKHIVEKYKLAGPSFALENIHFPKDGRHVLQSKYRLIFDELITLETGLFYLKNNTGKASGGIKISCRDTECFVENLSFELTSGQMAAWNQIKEDLESEKAMNRLIQGDVGSGKTVIAELSMFAAAKSGYQSVMMAPTEILAEQHYSTFCSDFAPYGIKVGMLCSSMKKSEKQETLEKLENGEIDILIGTHAVIQPGVKFASLGIVITDEQHRFGVNQRTVLSQKGENPNVLVMTATPIPRTLAVILYGDLDVSQIRTMPIGRKPVKTTEVLPENRNKAYEFVKKQIGMGRQAYVVAPLIEESDKINAKSAQELHSELAKKFKEYKVSLIHGGMKPDEKNEIMQEFSEGKIDILVSTVVIEVGINVANATVMVIENCERFGLAQLHQLRGRVGRGSEQSYCLLICHNQTEVSGQRNKIMCETTDGFVIAEEDLKLRGPGEIFGTRQHGLPEMHISDLVRHADVLEKARDCAKEIIESDPALEKTEFQNLKKRVKKMYGEEIKLQL